MSLTFSPTAERRIVRATWILTWFGLVAGQLHALARHATPEGQRDLDSSLLTRAWSVPASDALRPLLDWSDPYTVYTTYGKLWIPVYAAFTLCAFLVRSHRRPTGAELWGWRITLTAYILVTLSIVGDYLTPWMDQSFMFLGMPAAVLTLAGTLVLGVSLLRNGFRPKVTAWLLLLWLPSLLAITQVTSLGSADLAMAFGWAIAGSHLVATRRSQTAHHDRLAQTAA